MKVPPIRSSIFSFGSSGAAQAPVGRLSAREAFAKRRAGEIRLVDVRTPEEWRLTGVPEGAACIRLQDADFLDQLLTYAGSNETPLAFICRSGQRSGQAAAQARAAGFLEVYNVTGGVEGPEGWLEERLPVTSA